jgi:hypothetical protein
MQARGAEPDTHAQEASRHFHRGVELSEESDWRAALIEFERAYAIEPNFHVLYDIGQCRYQLHDYPGALEAFKSYLADGGELVSPERRATVQSDIDSLKGRVAFLRILTREVGAEVSVDDVVVGTTPLAAPVAVSAGRHKVAASKAGDSGEVRYVDVAGEEAVNVTLSLTSSEVHAPAATASPARSRSLVPALVAFGVAAVGVGVGSYLGVLALDDKRDLDRTCVFGSCPESSKPIYDDAQRNALWSTVGFGAAIVGAGAGAAYLIFAKPRESRSASATSARLRVVVGPGSIGVEGTF